MSITRGDNLPAYEPVQDNNPPSCACLHVKYDPIDNDDGAMSECWRCADCLTVFVKKSLLDRAVKRGDNHAETLRGISAMPVEDGERMQLWADDGLSGSNETVEATLLKVCDERNAMRTELESLRRLVDDLIEWCEGEPAENFADRKFADLISLARKLRGLG
jgi:hypothetical protein